MKTCSRCKQSKPLESFPKGNCKDGKFSWCRQCASDYQRERYTSNPEVRRKANLMYRYGLTPEAIDAKLVEQGGSCALCPKPLDPRTVHVDHDHACCSGSKSCGKCVRGLLCAGCNKHLGVLETWYPARKALLDAYVGRELLHC